MKTYDLAKRDLSHQECDNRPVNLIDSNAPCKVSHHKGDGYKYHQFWSLSNFVEKEVLVLQFSHTLKDH